MKPLWRGEITIGTIIVPVELYPAVQSRALSFKLLHAYCNTPLTYQRWCAYCQKVIDWEHVVKSIKLKGGLYFVLTPEHMRQLRATRTETIQIIECIHPTLISPIYFDTHYYLIPQDPSNQTYVLLLAALTRLKQIAIGTFTLRDKEYVCAIQPYKKVLLLTTLNYDYELRKVKKLKLPKPKGILAKEELMLIVDTIKTLSSATFTMKKYKDNFTKRLEKEIRKSFRKLEQ